MNLLRKIPALRKNVHLASLLSLAGEAPAR